VAVTAMHDAVWVANEGDDSVSRIDVSVGTLGKPISIGDAPAAIAVGGGTV
jgi:YVTN family beta-propeller protein